jgi:hypothetical protein
MNMSDDDDDDDDDVNSNNNNISIPHLSCMAFIQGVSRYICKRAEQAVVHKRQREVLELGGCTSGPKSSVFNLVLHSFNKTVSELYIKDY